MKIPLPLRDQLITQFREQICRELEIVPFEHQRTWWAVTDGSLVVPHAPGLPEVSVRLFDESIELRSLIPRPQGRAKVVAELAGYKAGKSYGAALWAAGFAAVPDARVYLVGIEYDMCAPEFEYLLEFLLSDRGLGLKPSNLQNRPKDGRLWLELENGARFEARSWERNESLKGKEVDAYLFCEAYQLPGIECFMSIKQNLRARQGYAVFPTTPDSPWISVLHDNGHGHPDYPDWVCQCGIHSKVNPYTYDLKTELLDERLMTREKYSIAYLGKIGTYLGRVFAYQRGERQITPASHPHLWCNLSGPATRENFKLPPHWTVVAGVDTGTYLGALMVALDDEGVVYVLDELTNYRYVGQTIELSPDVSLAGWATAFKRMCAQWGAPPTAWVDANSQFKHELWNSYGITLLGNGAGREARTEAARQHFQHNRIFLAPWLGMLPFELELAAWPDSLTSAGRFERVKVNDHLVDGLEHVCSRHLRGGRPQGPLPKPYWESWHRPRSTKVGDPHLGVM